MSVRYTLQESLSGFTRAKFSALISIITITISLLLLGIFTVLTVNASRFLELIRSKVEFEAFLQEPVTRQEIGEIQKRLAALEGVDSLTFISKEQAARIFKEEFGEDISSVLDFNPLPPSFKIRLRDGYKTAARAREVHDRIMEVKGVDHIIYRKALLELIDERATTANNLTLGLGLLVSLSAIFLVSNTIRLTIYAKRRLIRTMELVGATASFIRLPFLLEGLLQGLIGGTVAAGVLYLLLEYAAPLVSLEFSSFISMDVAFYPLVIAGGVALAFLGSLISIIRFIRFAGTA